MPSDNHLKLQSLQKFQKILNQTSSQSKYLAHYLQAQALSLDQLTKKYFYQLPNSHFHNPNSQAFLPNQTKTSNRNKALHGLNRIHNLHFLLVSQAVWVNQWITVLAIKGKVIRISFKIQIMIHLLKIWVQTKDLMCQMDFQLALLISQKVVPRILEKLENEIDL